MRSPRKFGEPIDYKKSEYPEYGSRSYIKIEKPVHYEHPGAWNVVRKADTL